MWKRGREAFLSSVRPEVAAGGYARDDSSVNFFTRVNALLDPDMTILDLGAGRGTSLLGQADFTKELRRLQGKVRKVIGIDVDDAILDHPYLDEKYVVDLDEPYPLNPESIDLVVCDWVLEHVADPSNFAREVGRVLKPGGWLCARTPNRWGYVGIATNLIPNRSHVGLLGALWPERHEVDVFPTVYKLNTRRALRRYFPESDWEHFSHFINPPPKYHGNRQSLFAIIGFWQAAVPSWMKTDMIVVLRKRSRN